MRYFTNINLSGNELQNASLQKLPSHPAHKKGLIYYNTTEDKIYVSDGTTWIDVDSIELVTSTPSALSVNFANRVYTIDHVEIANANITEETNKYVSGLTFDNYGHITSYKTGTEADGTLTVQGTNGLVGSGTFSANDRTNTTITVEHDDTSTEDSSFNSSGIVIQSVGIDDFGHVTHLATANLDERYARTFGTLSDTFEIGDNGTILKNTDSSEEVGLQELQLRNSDDTDFQDLRVRNLYTEGDRTVIESNEVNIGDNQILLNSDIDQVALNSSGGIAIKRLYDNGTDIVRQDAEFNFNNSIGRWEVTDGPVGDMGTFVLPRKYVSDILLSESTTVVVTHNLKTEDVTVSIRELGGDKSFIGTNIRVVDQNIVEVSVGEVPSQFEARVVVTG